MEIKNIYEELTEDQYLERKDEVINGLNMEYSKNHTISGLLNNVYDHYSKQDSDKPFYQFINKKIEFETLFGGRDIRKEPVVLYTNSNILYKNELGNCFYRQLINLHPCYDDKEDLSRLRSIWRKFKESTDFPQFIPHFIPSCGFIYADLKRCNEKGYNSESKKVYLDVGQENYDLLFEDILKLYCDLRRRVDDEIDNLRHTVTNQFKVRPGYANDGIVFRFYEDYQYEIFKELLADNKNILQSLRNSNPFLPTELIDGYPMGLLPDNGGSYNSYITDVCESYIVKCFNENNPIDIREFLKFLKEFIILDNNDRSLTDEMQKVFKKTLVNQVEREIGR